MAFLACWILGAVGFGFTGVASASDLFAWWQRDFLSVSLAPGDWVRMASLESGDGTVHADTLDCRVLYGDGDLRWVGFWPSGSEDWWLLRVDQSALIESHSLDAALQALYRVQPGGAGVEEDLDELRQSQLFRRRLEDPFEHPTVREEPLGETTLAGRKLERHEVELSERRERRIPLGRDETMLYSIELSSRAELSSDIPIFGLLRSRMLSTERTERVNAEGDRVGPPPEVQTTQRSLECLDFGHESPRGLPGFLR